MTRAAVKLERVAVSLSRGERDALRELAVCRSEPEATTAARLVRAGLADAGARLDAPPKRRRAPARRAAPSRANGTEPRAVAWLPASACAAAVAQLSERYPLELRDSAMPDPGDRAGAERLAALSVWRDQLDAGAHADPRVELMFSDELARTARWLEERRRKRR